MSCASRILYLPNDVIYCRLQGDDSLYGLGLRLGTYLLWATTVIANNASPRRLPFVRTLSTCYQFATLIAILYRSTGHASLFALDVHILLTLCVGGLLTSTLPPRPSSTWLATLQSFTHLDVSSLGGIMRLFVLPASSGYGLWYVFSGMDGFCRSTCTNEVVFFFAKVKLFGWYRSLLKSLFSIMTFSVIVSLFATLARSVARNRSRSETTKEEKNREKEPRFGLLVIGTATITIFIVAIELPLYWNRTVGVSSCHSAAELLPIVVAAAALCETLRCISGDFGLGKVRLREN